MILTRLSGFDVHFNQNPCKFEPRVPKVFTTGAVLLPGPQQSHEAAADRVMITATALATFGVPARAGIPRHDYLTAIRSRKMEIYHLQ